MNHPAHCTETAATEPEYTEDSVTLRVIDRTALADWTQPTGQAPLANSHCLLYLVPLEGPRIRSTVARRLRLKDSLSGGSASHNAGTLAKDPHFWDYLQQINLTAYAAEIGTRRARYFINRVCGVDGRHELDRSAEAGQRFFTLIEQPFLDWLCARDRD